MKYKYEIIKAIHPYIESKKYCIYSRDPVDSYNIYNGIKSTGEYKNSNDIISYLPYNSKRRLNINDTLYGSVNFKKQEKYFGLYDVVLHVGEYKSDNIFISFYRDRYGSFKSAALNISTEIKLKNRYYKIKKIEAM